MRDDEWRLPIDPTRPIYAQIVRGLLVRIARGELAASQGLPSVRALAQRLQVNPNTVQRAYRELEALGVVESHPGQGTFVRPDPQVREWVRDRAAREAAQAAVRQLRELGLDAATVERYLLAAVRSEGEEHGGT